MPDRLPVLDLLSLHARLAGRFGPQGWWPGQGPWDVCTGAVLTQNTRWRNAELALAGLASAGAVGPDSLLGLGPRRLEEAIRSAGFFRQKARALRAVATWLLEAGGFDELGRLDGPRLRRELMNMPGIGEETADCILLYAFGRPVFIADAYARRLLSRAGLWKPRPREHTYRHLKVWVEARLCPDKAGDRAWLGEFHALIVAAGKDHCRATPRCGDCPLCADCPTGSSQLLGVE